LNASHLRTQVQRKWRNQAIFSACRQLHTETEDEDPFGAYDLILPPEPLIEGVAHIPIRPVPLHITRPPYVGKQEDDPIEVEGPYIGDGRIQLGGEDERKLRKAGMLAKRVLHETKNWSKVHLFLLLCHEPTLNFWFLARCHAGGD